MGITHDLDSSERYVPILLWVLLIAVNLFILLANENNFLTRKLCRPGWSLIVLNRASHVGFYTAPRSFWAWDLLDARHLVTSYVVPASVLLAIRVFAFTVFCFTILWQELGLIKYASRFPRAHGEWLTYFEDWVFVAFALYAAFGVVVSVQSWFAPPSERYQLHDTARALGVMDRLFLLVVSVVSTCSVAMTAMYWGFVYDWEEKRTPYVDEVIRNGGPTVLVLLDVWLSRIPVVSYHFIVSVWFSSAYLVLMWIWYFANATWRYPQLAWDHGPAAFWHYAVAFACLCGGFGMMWFVALIREMVFNCELHECICRPLCCLDGLLSEQVKGERAASTMFDAVPQILVTGRASPPRSTSPSKQPQAVEARKPTPGPAPWMSRFRRQPGGAAVATLALPAASTSAQPPTPMSSGIGRYGAATGQYPPTPPSTTPSNAGRYTSTTYPAAPPSAAPSSIGRYGGGPSASPMTPPVQPSSGIGRYTAASAPPMPQRSFSRSDAADSQASYGSGDELPPKPKLSPALRPSDAQQRAADQQQASRRPSEVQRRLETHDSRGSSARSAVADVLRSPQGTSGSQRLQQEPPGSGRKRPSDQAW